MKSLVIKLICATILASSLSGCIIIDRSGANHFSSSDVR